MKTMSVIVLSIFFVQSAFAQYSRLKNSTSSQFGLGFTDAGILVNGYYVKTFDQRVKAEFGAGIVWGRIADVDYKSAMIDGIVSFTLTSKKMVSFSALTGVTFAGDLINDFPSDYNKQFSFNYGVLGGGEAEFSATRKISFVLTAAQRYYVKKDFGQWRPQVSVGVRVSI